MANGVNGKNNSLLVGVLIGAAVVALAVLAYIIISARASRW